MPPIIMALLSILFFRRYEMDLDSKIKEEDEKLVNERMDEMWRKHNSIITEILYSAIINNTEELSKSYLWLLTEYFLEYYPVWTDDEEFQIGRIQKILYFIENNDKFNVPSRYLKLFYEYCYIIRQSVFCSLGQSYTKGISYEELVEKALKKAGIETISDKSKKMLYNNFRVYIQKCNEGSGNFHMNSLPIWSSHIGMKEKNKGKDSIDSVLYRDRGAFEFEFYIRPKNKSNDKELKRITEKLEEETNRRILIIFEELGFKEIIQNWDRYRKDYSKLAQTPMRDMNEEELKLYLKFMDCKRIYVRRNTEGIPHDGVLAERWLSYILTYSLLEQHYSTHFDEQVFSIAGGILSKINIQLAQLSPQEIESFIKELLSQDMTLEDFSPKNPLSERVFWNGMLRLLNMMDNFINTLNTQGIGFPRSYCEVFENKELFDQFKKLAQNATVIQPKVSKEIIENQFIKKLWKDNAGWSDLIEICYLTTYCISWAEERNEEVYSRKMLDREELDLFEKAFSYIIEFLKLCVEKSKYANSAGEEKVNISDEIRNLKCKLNSLEIILNTENFIPAYYDGNIQKDKKKKSVSYLDYFQKCLETAPVRLYLILEEEIENDSFVDIEMFIQKYMKSILERRKGEEVLVPSKYNKLLNNILFVRLTCSVRYSRRVQANIRDFYSSKQQRLLSLCDKYDIKKAFWHSDNDDSCEAKECI